MGENIYLADSPIYYVRKVKREMKVKHRKKSKIYMRFFFLTISVVFLAHVYSSKKMINMKAKEAENVTVNDGTQFEYELPLVSKTLTEPQLSGNSRFDGYVQSQGVKSILNVDSTDLGAFTDDDRSVIPVAMYKYEDDYLIFNRMNHNNKVSGNVGGLQVLKVNVNGDEIAQWTVGTTNVTTFRFQGGTFLGKDNTVFSIFNNGDTDPKGLRKHYSDGSKFMLYGVDASIGYTDENQGDDAILVNLEDIDSDFVARNDLRVLDQSGNEAKIASSIQMSSKDNRMNYGTFYFDPDDPSKSKWEVDITLQIDLSPDLEGVGAQTYSNSLIDPISIGKLEGGDGYYALVTFQDQNTPQQLSYTSLQIFNSDGSLRVSVPTNEIRNVNQTRYGESAFLFEEETSNELYYFEKGRENSYISKYNYKTNVQTIVQTFPAMTSLNFDVNEFDKNSDIPFFGTTTSMTQAFSGFGVNDNEVPTIISGVISSADDGFKVQSLSNYDSGLTSTGIQSDTIFQFVDKLANDSYFVSGGTSSASLASKIVYSPLDSSSTTNLSGHMMSFYGEMIKVDDFSPAISPNGSNIVVESDAEGDDLESQLLSGIDGNQPIKVFDTVDDVTLEGRNQLIARINRNPNDYTLPIDWKALGFENNQQVGSNKVSYFTTDSQRQTSVTSRYVNKVDSNTKYDQGIAKAALHAGNFVIDVADIGSLTKDKLINEATTNTYGHVFAWDMDTGANLNDSVVVDDEDFKALKAATKFGRFPLKYTITRNGEPVTNSTMVFVKGETEAISEDEKYLISAHDFSVATKDYPKTDAALTTMIHDEAKAKLFNVTTDTDMDLSNLVITKGQLPGANTAGSYVPDGKYKVLLSYGTIGTKSYVEKEITVTVTQSTFEMTLNQVYAEKTSQAIYSDLETKATVDNSPTYTQDYGETIQTIVDNLFSDEDRKLNYEGYETLVSTAYTVYVDGVKVTPTPIYVPAEDFTVEFHYTGQLKFKETAAKLDFGSIPITNSTTTTALTSDSDDMVSIINTDLVEKWRLKASVPKGINRSGDSHPFIGDLYYQDGKGEGVPIGKQAVLIEAQQDSDTTLLSQVKLRVNQTTGLFLRQGVGNLTGTYEGELYWILEDGPLPGKEP